MSNAYSLEYMYLIVVREEWGGAVYWREVGRDDTESCAWNYAYTWLIDNPAYSLHDIGVLQVEVG